MTSNQPNAPERIRPWHAVGLWILALGFAALASRNWSFHTKLTLVGATLEVAGLFLLTFDLVGPPIETFGARARAQLGYLVIAAMLLRGRNPPVMSVQAGVATATATASGAGAVVGPAGEGPTLEQLQVQLAALTRLVDNLVGRQQRDVAALRNDFTALRRDVNTAIHEAIRQSKGEFFALRMTGFAVALLGSLLLAAAHLV